MSFNFIPDNTKDFETLSDFKDQKELFLYLREHYPKIKDPIAIDLSQKNHVKVTRGLQGLFNPSTFRKSPKLKISFGEGSRGNRGSANRGNGFETSYLGDIHYWIEGKKIDTQIEKSIEKIFALNKITSRDVVRVIAEGANNKARPLIFSGENIYIGTASDPNVGAVLTDLTIVDATIETEKKNVYLSLKLGKTVTFFNSGIKTVLTKDDIKSGTIKSEKGIALLNMFGINHTRFCSVFNAYDKEKAIHYHEEDTTSTINKSILTKFIKSGIGYGYTMVHNINSSIDVYLIDKAYLDTASVPQSCKVFYGGKSGDAKRVDMVVETPKYVLKFNIRDKNGGIYPSHILCDYKKK